MRFSAQLPTDRVTKGAEFTSAAAIGEMARALEVAGFDAAYVTEHPFPPDAWLASGGHHALDPFVSLVAAGYLEGEYRALGADFAGRNEAADDALRAMKRAWSGASVRYEGRGYRAEGSAARSLTQDWPASAPGLAAPVLGQAPRAS